MSFNSWIHSGADIAEEEASELEGLAIETKMKEGKTTWKRKATGHLQGPHVQAVGVPAREAIRGTEKLFEEIGAPNFPNLMQSINPQIQEAE